MPSIQLEYGIPCSETSTRDGGDGQGALVPHRLPDIIVRKQLDIRTKLSDSDFAKIGAGMDKRDRFIAEIKNEARAMGLSFRVDYRKGKGGHAMVYVGDKLTTLPSREIDPKTARKIRKQLGLAD
jgi:hypothetical protein